MYITTVTKGDDTTYRLHRDACKALNDSKRTVEAQLANDAQIVLDATACSTCKPSKAVQVSVRAEAEKALKGKAPKAAETEEQRSERLTARRASIAAEASKAPEAEATEEQPTEAAEAPKAEETTEAKTTGRGRSLAVKDGEQKCDTCGQTLPLTKFPTLSSKAGEVPARGTTCREDIKKARAEKKAAASK